MFDTTGLHSFAARHQYLQAKSPDASVFEDASLQLIPLLVELATGQVKSEIPSKILDDATSMALESLLGKESLVQLASLAKELDPDLQCKGYLLLGEELEQEGKLAAAALIFSWLQNTLGKVQGDWAEEYLPRIQENMNGLTGGEGPSSLRTESWFRNLSSTLVDPSTVAAFVAGEAVFRLTRFGAFKRLMGVPRIGGLSPLAMELSPSLLAAVAETGTFTSTQIGVQKLLGQERPDNSSDRFRALGKTLLTLGGLRLGSWAFSGIGQKIAVTGGLQKSVLRDYLWERGGAMTGLLLGAKVIGAAGWEQPTSNEKINDRALGYLALSSLNQGLWTWVGRGLKLNLGTYGKF